MANPKTSVSQITWEDVVAHNSHQTLWVAVHGKVYDLTKFLDTHPGGPEILLQFAGKDGTEAWDDVGHSTDARNMMKEYVVGQVVGEIPTSLAVPDKSKQHGQQGTKDKKDCIIVWGTVG